MTRDPTANASQTSRKLSIVTPSRNMLGYLRRCAASIVDQQVPVQHIVMDACSDDGTADWLALQELEAVIEPDRGMYDALNKGFKRATGDLLGYLNCDEQYLPGTLARVCAHFERHPETDILFGGCLLVAPDGTLIAYRKGYPPRWPFIVASHLYVLSCTMFFRRRLWDQGLRFDDQLRDIADARFVVDALRSGARADVLDQYLSAFTMTGRNMSAGENAARERARFLYEVSPWLAPFRVPLNALRLLDKARHGCYWQRFPLRYALYLGDTGERSELCATRGSHRWRSTAP